MQATFSHYHISFINFSNKRIYRTTTSFFKKMNKTKTKYTMELHYMIQIFQMYLIRHGKIHLIDSYHNKKFIYLITFQSYMKSLKDDIMSRQNSMHVFLKV